MRVLLRSIAVLLLAAAAVHALEVPPPPTQWVTDHAGVLDSAARERLNAKLREFEQRSGAQFIVYILPSLEGDSLEDFSIRAAQRWRVGQEKYDNGLILFVFPQDRRMRIEVGYGLEGSVTDAISSRVIRQDLTPAFQRGDFAGGLEAATDHLIHFIETGEEPVPLAGRGSGQPVRIPFWVFLLVPFFVIFVLGPLSRRRGAGGCLGPACLIPFVSGGSRTYGSHHRGGFGGGFGGGGFGGFSGGGGGFGGGGASGSW